MTGGPEAPARRRAFVALDLPEPLRLALAAVAEDLRPALTGVRWVAPANLHLTLRFLGWTKDAILDALQGKLADAAAGCPPLTGRVSGLGVFPERGRARVVWAGIDLPPAVTALHGGCEAAARSLGFAPEQRGFSPHLTLGRWSLPAKRPNLPAADLGVHTLDRLVLFESVLRPAGPVYTPLRVFTLRG